jgi:hypothetical protein
MTSPKPLPGPPAPYNELKRATDMPSTEQASISPAGPHGGGQHQCKPSKSFCKPPKASAAGRPHRRGRTGHDQAFVFRPSPASAQVSGDSPSVRASSRCNGVPATRSVRGRSRDRYAPGRPRDHGQQSRQVQHTGTKTAPAVRDPLATETRPFGSMVRTPRRRAWRRKFGHISVSRSPPETGSGSQGPPGAPKASRDRPPRHIAGSMSWRARPAGTGWWN